jgi:glycine/D-amino acid oxidase-like deaminating enzyme/CRP-like cAMP-binding protein
VVIIGAGLTGASAAYHLREAIHSRHLRVVVLDQGDPACEASGRNGGNFELIPENCVGTYEGLARGRLTFLRRCYPGVPDAVRRAESERQASLVLGLAVRNRDRLKTIVQQERIDCDFSPRGWLYLAHTEQEEQALCEEVTLAAQHGQRVELWSRRRIRDEFGFKTAYLGRFIPGDGTYHPFKYACGVLQSALRSGVELYTRRAVREIVADDAEGVSVRVDGGHAIRTQTVIVATNAFTSRLLPELEAIRPFQSQIMVTEHAPDRAGGRVVTTEFGPTFFNQPRGGRTNGRAPLLMGGGADRLMRNPSSRRRSPQVHARLLRLRDAFYPELTGQPPSAEWIGPMGFTPDQLPAIGFLRPGVIVAAGFNGYGGTYTTAAGQAAAIMALTGSPPEWVPEDVFSPRRFLHDEPLFLLAHESLWRIAASLCQQLRTVDDQTTDGQPCAAPGCAGTEAVQPASPADWRPPPTLRSAREADLAARELQRLAPFHDFTLDELKDLAAQMRRWEVLENTLLCAEGAPGTSCFVVLGGSVDVTSTLGGRPRRLASLGPGNVFGQVSLIDGQPRSATCIVRRSGVVLEMERDACARLFESRSSSALKFLAILNQGLIAALRGADRRLMRLQVDNKPDPLSDAPIIAEGIPPHELVDANSS